MTDSDPSGEQVAITHGKVGKQLGLPPELLDYAARHGLIEHGGRRGQWYMFAPGQIPDREQVIAAAREEYRALLRRIDASANAVLAEFEAVQDDAREMLENYTDPVGEFGDDLEMVTDLRQGSTLHRHLDRLRSLTFDARSLHRCLYALDRPDLHRDDAPAGDQLPVRPRRADRQTGTE